MPNGTVKWFNPTKGYGFIKPDDSDTDMFVHVSAVISAGLDTLQTDQKLSYEVEQGQGGRTSAVDLKLID